MNNLVGTTFYAGSTQYIVDSVEAYDESLTHLIAAAKKSGQDAAMYFASKVLKSGKKSKQGGMFYRYAESGDFMKVM